MLSLSVAKEPRREVWEIRGMRIPGVIYSKNWNNRVECNVVKKSLL